MKLLIFAHRAEAQSFLKHFKYSPTEYQTLFKTFDHYLLISGEGVMEASTSVAYFLGVFPEIEEVLNFGVAGVLNDLELNQVIEVRHAYHFIHGQGEFKSFPVGLGKVDIVTSRERILNEHEAAKLRTMGDLVDRECWGVGYSCKAFKKNLRSFKFLSDKAGELGACELVQDKALLASEKLLEVYLNLDEKSLQKKNHIISDQFYFTTSMKREMDKLLERIEIKYQRKSEDVFKEFQDSIGKDEGKNSKDRGKELLAELRNLADPEIHAIKDRIKDLIDPFLRDGVKIDFDSNLEFEDLVFQFKSDKNSFDSKLNMIKEFPWSDFQKILNGRF